MDLESRLMEDLKASMKGGDRIRTGVIRMLRTDLKNAAISKGEALEESEVLDILSRYARKRADAAGEYRRGGREDLAEKEEAEGAIVRDYLPEALDEAELAAIVDEVVASLDVSGMKHMGTVMKEVLARSAGRAEGSAVSALVKERLMK